MLSPPDGKGIDLVLMKKSAEVYPFPVWGLRFQGRKHI